MDGGRVIVRGKRAVCKGRRIDNQINRRNVHLSNGGLSERMRLGRRQKYQNDGKERQKGNCPSHGETNEEGSERNSKRRMLLGDSR